MTKEANWLQHEIREAGKLAGVYLDVTKMGDEPWRYVAKRLAHRAYRLHGLDLAPVEMAMEIGPWREHKEIEKGGSDDPRHVYGLAPERDALELVLCHVLSQHGEEEVISFAISRRAACIPWRGLV